MKDIGIVQGSAEQALPFVINKNVVYVHTDIKKLEITDEEMKDAVVYEYHEFQYSIDEYLQMAKEQSDSQNAEIMLAIAELGTMIAGDVNG